MQHPFTFTRRGLTRACSTRALGLTVALLAASSAWSQPSGSSGSKGSAGSVKAGAPDGAAGQVSRRWMKEDFAIPEHESALNQEREEIEILTVQVAAKKAALRVAEIRLRQAKNSDEKEVLQAEVDAGRAALLEPELLLKRAQKRLKELEQVAEGGHQLGVGHPGMMGMGHPGMGHPGMMGMGPGMGHPGMMGMGHPGMMDHHWAMMREVQIENNLNLLRVAVERLEEEVDGLLDGSVKPGSGIKPSTGSDGSSKDKDAAK